MVQPSHSSPGWEVTEASLALSPITAGTSAATRRAQAGGRVGHQPRRQPAIDHHRPADRNGPRRQLRLGPKLPHPGRQCIHSFHGRHTSIEGSPLLRRATQRRSKKVRQEASMPKLSPVDRVLLTELQKNARITNRALAQAAGIAESTCLDASTPSTSTRSCPVFTPASTWSHSTATSKPSSPCASSPRPAPPSRASATHQPPRDPGPVRGLGQRRLPGPGGRVRHPPPGGVRARPHRPAPPHRRRADLACLRAPPTPPHRALDPPANPTHHRT